MDTMCNLKMITLLKFGLKKLAKMAFKLVKTWSNFKPCHKSRLNELEKGIQITLYLRN